MMSSRSSSKPIWSGLLWGWGGRCWEEAVYVFVRVDADAGSALEGSGVAGLGEVATSGSDAVLGLESERMLDLFEVTDADADAVAVAVA